MPPAAISATAPGSFSTEISEKDPYQYQVGFGNSFATEALYYIIPCVLPNGQNMPQKNKFGLYMEGVTGSPFVSPRAQSLSAFLYRIRPSVAHSGFTRLPDNPDTESCFLPINPKVHVSPGSLSWHPFKTPSDSERVDFIDGLKTLAGNGDPTLREGLSIGIYLANTSMDKRAFSNNDGDMLIVPQQGRLDIQTEMGKLMVKPGEFCVIQRGIKFKVVLPDGPARGYVNEIYGSHFELPDLGPLGSHGLANPRDFEYPLASFDLDQSEWNSDNIQVTYPIPLIPHHTPFDVVAWHGNHAPYKYDMEKFVYVGSISKDHLDSSIFCVLTAKSKQPHISLFDFMVIGKRWDVSNTFRPAYFHRNGSEFVGVILGGYGHGDYGYQPGGANLDSVFSPHGVTNDMFELASEAELQPMVIFEDTLLFMIEPGAPTTVTDYAIKRSGKLYLHDRKMWTALKDRFTDKLDDVNEHLKAAGRPQLGL